MANVWFSSHNFSEAAVIEKIPKFVFLLCGADMLNDMPCRPSNFGNIEIFELQLLRENYD